MYTPGEDDWITNMVVSIYRQMLAAAMDDPESFREVLERTHLETNDHRKIIASMHAIKHFSGFLYASPADLEEAVSSRIEDILETTGRSLQ